MRFSPYPANRSETVLKPKESNLAFFEAVARQAERDSLHGAILLIGARDPRSLARRRAQGALRFDRLDSYWSHAALLVRWDTDPNDTEGVEVSLAANWAEQVPERNGVTVFRLGKYADSDLYPNLAIVAFSFAERKPAE